MVSAGLSCNGITKPFFTKPNKTKVNAQYYTSYIQKRLTLACLKIDSDNYYYFVQDRASSHTSKSSSGIILETEGSIQKVQKGPFFTTKKLKRAPLN